VCWSSSGRAGRGDKLLLLLQQLLAVDDVAAMLSSVECVCWEVLLTANLLQTA
jgi:hypothetical protein